MDIKRSGSQPSGKGPAEYFIGSVRIDPLGVTMAPWYGQSFKGRQVEHLGVCAGGGYAVNAPQTERRIKAVAGVSSVDLGAFLKDGLGGVVSLAERQKTLEEVGKQRTRKARGGPILLVPIVADSADELTDETPRLNR